MPTIPATQVSPFDDGEPGGPIDPFMRRRDVLLALGIPNSTFYAMQARGEFKRGVRITKRCVGWRRSYVVEFMNSRRPLETEAA